jgi:hypothetical protein
MLPGNLPRWLDAFARWDALHYLTIAAVGVAPGPDGSPPQHAGFFPGYPAAVRGLTSLINLATGRAGAGILETPLTALVAAFAVSNLALLLAAIAIFRLARTFLDAAAAERSAIWMLTWPTAFFGSAYLAESLFLWLSIEATIAAHRRRMLRAAMIGGCASFTRLFGVLLLVPLFLYSLRGRVEPRRVLRDALLMLAVPAGAGLVVFWHARALGHPWAYFDIQADYGHASFPSVAGFVDLFRIAGKDAVSLARDGIQVAALAAAVACLAAIVRGARVPLALVAYAVVSILVYALADHLLSLPRYLFSVFPLFVGAAMLVPEGRPTVVLQAVSTLLQVAGFVAFMRGWPLLV